MTTLVHKRHQSLILAGLMLSSLATVANADTLLPYASGSKSWSFSSVDGHLLGTNFYMNLGYGGSVGPYYGLDARYPGGSVTVGVLTFQVSDIDPTQPVTLNMNVTESWGYFGHANLAIGAFGSEGILTSDQVGGFSGPGDFNESIAQGDYRANPILLSYDVTSYAAKALELGHDFLAFTFSVDGVSRAAYVTMKDVWLTASMPEDGPTGPLATVPEPASLALLATAGILLGLARMGRRGR